MASATYIMLSKALKTPGLTIAVHSTELTITPVKQTPGHHRVMHIWTASDKLCLDTYGKVYSARREAQGKELRDKEVYSLGDPGMLQQVQKHINAYFFPDWGNTRKRNPKKVGKLRKRPGQAG